MVSVARIRGNYQSADIEDQIADQWFQFLILKRKRESHREWSGMAQMMQ